MKRSNFVVAAWLAIVLGAAAQAEQITVKHVQAPMHRFMVARSEAGKIIANVEFSQAVQRDEVTMHVIYRFVDGSIDDEETTYTQHGRFRLVRDHHVQNGPFFARPIDFTVDAATGTVTSRTVDKNGKIRIQRKHMDLPDDLANGFVGTLLLNVPPATRPFRVAMLAPVGGGRLIQLLISPTDEQTVHLAGQSFPATVFRIHPELGGIVSLIARLLGLQPKDVMVWVLEGEDPAVAVIVGQLGGSGPVVSSDLVGTSFGK
ncbi:MAG: hypothetical protein ACLGXA_16505 [Acidobacteriota bacterium]